MVSLAGDNESESSENDCYMLVYVFYGINQSESTVLLPLNQAPLCTF